MELTGWAAWTEVGRGVPQAGRGDSKVSLLSGWREGHRWDSRNVVGISGIPGLTLSRTAGDRGTERRDGRASEDLGLSRQSMTNENTDSRRETSSAPRTFRGRTRAQEERTQEATERTMRGRKPAAACGGRPRQTESQ